MLTFSTFNTWDGLKVKIYYPKENNIKMKMNTQTISFHCSHESFCFVLISKESPHSERTSGSSSLWSSFCPPFRMLPYHSALPWGSQPHLGTAEMPQPLKFLLGFVLHVGRQPLLCFLMKYVW